MKPDFDLIVIGGGAAGLTAAGMSAALGAKTALVERKSLGGDCTWHGCIPSKSLLKAAKVAQQCRQAGRFGLASAVPAHDLGRVMEAVRATRQKVYEDSDAPHHFEKLGVRVFHGSARFVSPHEIEVSGGGPDRHLSARRFVIATGTSPRLLQIPGPCEVPWLTNETIFELDRMPPRLLIVGAGPVGVEMAQAFARLGSEVTVVEASERILSKDDRELSSLLLERLRTEGIRFLFKTSVAAFDRRTAVTTSGERIEADAVLVAAGRVPNIGSLNLAAAGVKFSGEGILIDGRCRTSAGHIYAAGDVAGCHQFTHMAEHMAKVAVTNAILRIPMRMDDKHVPRTTFTDPELAHIGETEDDLIRRGARYSKYEFPYSQLDRAVADAEEVGLIKVLANRWGRILGATILGAHAGELIGEWAVAMKHGIRLHALSSTIRPYPTYGIGNRRAADLFVTAQFSPWLARLVRWAFRLRGGPRALIELRRRSSAAGSTGAMEPGIGEPAGEGSSG